MTPGFLRRMREVAGLGTALHGATESAQAEAERPVTGTLRVSLVAALRTARAIEARTQSLLRELDRFDAASTSTPAKSTTHTEVRS